MLAFRFLPNSLPNTDLNVDFFLWGFPILVRDRTLPIDVRTTPGCSGCGMGASFVRSDAVEAVLFVRPKSTGSEISISLRRGSGTDGSGNRICLSNESLPIGVAIDAPGVLIGNSSSSMRGIGADIDSFFIENPVFERTGPSGFHFPGFRNLFILYN